MTLRDAVARFLRTRAASPDQAALLQLALVEFDRRMTRSAPWPIAHRLPALVDAAVTGTRGRSELCMATACVEMGMDILDHIADNELGPHWRSVPLGAVVLAATGLVGVLPHIAISELDASAETRAALHGALARGLPPVGGGQQRDLSVRSPDDALAALDKTGARYALYDELAAIRAGHLQPDRWADFGHHPGAARQLVSDCSDLVADDSRDLAAGVRTFPIALAVERDASLAEALSTARTDPAVRQAVARAIEGSGVLRRAAFEVEVRVQRGLAVLDETGAAGSGRDALADLIQSSAVL